MRTAGSVILLLCAVAGCGIGGTDTVEEIQPEELAALDQTTTTTTTTVAPVETTEPSAATETVVPPSGPVQPETTVVEATTTPPTELVPLYFVNGSQLVAVETPVESPVAERRVLDALGVGPPPAEFEAGVRTVVPPALVTGLRKGPTLGLITVHLAGDLFYEIDSENQRYVVAQIVLTLTTMPGIDHVLFTVDRQPIRVYQRNNELTEVGEPVTYEDYAELIAESAPSR